MAACYFPERSKELTFRLAINLDLDEKDPFHFILDPDAVEMPFGYDKRTAALLAAYRETRLKQELKVPGWDPPTPRTRRGTVHTLVDLNKRLHESATKGARKAKRFRRRRRFVAGAARVAMWLSSSRNFCGKWDWPPA